MAATVEDVAKLLAHPVPGIDVSSPTTPDYKFISAALSTSAVIILAYTGGKWDTIDEEHPYSICDYVQKMAAYRFYLNPEYEASNQLVELRTLNPVAAHIAIFTPVERDMLDKAFNTSGGSLSIINFGNADYGWSE